MEKNQTSAPEESKAGSREKIIVRTGWIGVAVNLLLAAGKAAIGLIAGSIAVLLDAVNNLSDALSSIITVVGAKLAGRAPDKKHPLGHGRIEYMTALVVSAVVIYAGVTALVESIKKIIEPQAPDYSILSLVLIAAAVVAKILLGRYVRRVGKKVNSTTLVASGTDATYDAILSSSVLAAAILFRLTGLSLEAYVGVLISGFILKAGFGMTRETLNDILGSRTDHNLAVAIKETLCADPAVHGAFDLFLYNYGPDRNYGSVHVEVDDTLTAAEIDAIERRLSYAVYAAHGVILTGISIYSVNTTDDEVASMREEIRALVLAEENVLQIHGFFIDTLQKCGHFDVVLAFGCDHGEALGRIRAKLAERYPDYSFTIQPDLDVTD